MIAWLADKLGGGAAKEIVSGIGAGVGNVMDRFWPKKMSEAEKLTHVKDVMGLENQAAGIEVADVNKAREMYMTFLRTQKLPWVVRFLNGIYRPFCGFMAIFYLTDKFWAQVLVQLLPDFQWTLIERDPIVDGLVAVIVYFFFGYRQRAKEKGVANIS